MANMRPFLVDVLLATVLTVLTLVTMTGYLAGWADLPGYVLAALTAAPIAVRQRAPVWSLGVTLTALTLYSPMGYGVVPNAGIGLLIGMFTVATMRSHKVAAGMCALSIVVLLINSLNTAVPLTWPEVVQALLLVPGAWGFGLSNRRWGERNERLAEEAAQAVANEQVRIARELHDVVAHHMSVISVQAGVAEYLLDADPATARGAITTVGDSSREALKELRRLLDVLRVDHSADSDAADFTPQPGLAMLDELADRTRGAGLPIELTVTGTPRQLPAGPDLCAYRVAQESLTNVLKHAGPATARIDLEYGARTLTLKITDDGVGASKNHHESTPHGIRGMRERAELYGGVLTAGPLQEGGFRVVLRLPMDDAE